MRLSLTLLSAGLALVLSNAHAADVPTDWVDVQAGPMFTVKAPPGTSFERIRTGDAFAGAFHGTGFELKVEFGYHREDLKMPASISAPKMEKITVDEKPGTITTGASGDAMHPFYVGLHVPAVENDLLGPLSLVIDGGAVNAEGRDTVERIYRSVTFGFKN